MEKLRSVRRIGFMGATMQDGARMGTMETMMETGTKSASQTIILIKAADRLLVNTFPPPVYFAKIQNFNKSNL